MNWLKYLVGVSALIIAGCAAYFSVTGLGVLFAGASISVMVMASSLEFAKLVAATYLKQKWHEITGFSKWYLVSAVALLMLITSAGIFGYLSNAFQAQSLQLQQVDREIAVHQTKIDQNTIQITQLSTQITEFNTNQSKILDGGKVNSRLIRSIDNRDKQIAKINDKISNLQIENSGETEKINEIKIKNLDLEKEVGGFRFVAEAFGMELKNVVKFFIFLIVIVFDPLAVALIIAFNGLVLSKTKTREELLTEMMENDQKLGLYEVYGDTKEDIVENNRIPIDLDGDGTVDGYDTDNDEIGRAHV
jgi:cell division protein FtsL